MAEQYRMDAGCTCGGAADIIDQLKKDLKEAHEDIEWLLENSQDAAAMNKFRSNRNPNRATQYIAMESPPSVPLPSLAMENSSEHSSLSSVASTSSGISPRLAPAPQSGGPMIESQFRALLERIATAPSNVRAEHLQVAQQHMFTCAQFNALVSVLTFEDERQTCIEMLSSQVLDPENFEVLNPEARRVVERLYKESTEDEAIGEDAPEDTRAVRHRGLVIDEILRTEREYIHDLELVVKLFVQPVSERGLLSKQEISSVFSNVMVLLPLNKQILSDFENRPSVDYVGDVFLRMADFLKMYTDYCANQPTALATLERSKKKNPKLESFLDDCMSNPKTKGINLFGYLIKPVQRLCKYPLLLRELLNNTPPTHQDHANLMKALEKINDIVGYVNERKRLAENLQRILDIQTTLEGCSLDLVDPARRFVNEGTLKMVGKKKTGKLFLFNDVILWAKIDSKVFKYSGHIALSSLKVIDCGDTEAGANMWELNDRSNPATKVIFAAETPEQKRGWLRDIKTLVKEYQIREAQEKQSTQQTQRANLERAASTLGTFVVDRKTSQIIQRKTSSQILAESASPPVNHNSSSSIECDRCQEEPAFSECLDCGLPFCDMCYLDVHSRGKYRQHTSRPVGSASSPGNGAKGSPTIAPRSSTVNAPATRPSRDHIPPATNNGNVGFAPTQAPVRANPGRTGGSPIPARARPTSPTPGRAPPSSSPIPARARPTSPTPGRTQPTPYIPSRVRPTSPSPIPARNSQPHQRRITDPPSRGTVVSNSPTTQGMMQGSSPKSNGNYPVYPLAKLKTKPPGIDHKNLEYYLSVEEFQQLFGMTKDEWSKLPAWKQKPMKLMHGLF